MSIKCQNPNVKNQIQHCELVKKDLSSRVRVKMPILSSGYVNGLEVFALSLLPLNPACGRQTGFLTISQSYYPVRLV
jgi:hypothetical protein